MPSDYAIDYKILTGNDWQDALQVQNASNLSGVTLSFLALIQKVRDEAGAQNLGWAWADHHPILRLFAYKIAALVGQEDVTFGVSDDYRKLESLGLYYIELSREARAY